MKDYLPLGSVVLLKEGKKKLMIYGRKQIHAQTKEIYDYVGCLFPEGNISKKFTFLFNREDIGQVFFQGYVDQEEQAFRKSFLNKEEG